MHTSQVTKLKENFRSFWLYNVEYAFYWSDPVFQLKDEVPRIVTNSQILESGQKNADGPNCYICGVIYDEKSKI